MKEALSWDRYEVQPVKDRSRKVTRRKSKMPVNGIAMKRLLIERAVNIHNSTVKR